MLPGSCAAWTHQLEACSWQLWALSYPGTGHVSGNCIEPCPPAGYHLVISVSATRGKRITHLYSACVSNPRNGGCFKPLSLGVVCQVALGIRTSSLENRSRRGACRRMEELGLRADIQRFRLQREEEKTKELKRQWINFKEKTVGNDPDGLLLLNCIYRNISLNIFIFILYGVGVEVTYQRAERRSGEGPAAQWRIWKTVQIIGLQFLAFSKYCCEERQTHGILLWPAFLKRALCVVSTVSVKPWSPSEEVEAILSEECLRRCGSVFMSSEPQRDSSGFQITRLLVVWGNGRDPTFETRELDFKLC